MKLRLISFTECTRRIEELGARIVYRELDLEGSKIVGFEDCDKNAKSLSDMRVVFISIEDTEQVLNKILKK